MTEAIGAWATSSTGGADCVHAADRDGHQPFFDAPYADVSKASTFGVPVCSLMAKALLPIMNPGGSIVGSWTSTEPGDYGLQLDDGRQERVGVGQQVPCGARRQAVRSNLAAGPIRTPARVIVGGARSARRTSCSRRAGISALRDRNMMRRRSPRRCVPLSDWLLVNHGDIIYADGGAHHCSRTHAIWMPSCCRRSADRNGPERPF